jgi:hypothetical protein
MDRVQPLNSDIASAAMVGLVGVVFRLGCASGGGGRMPADESDDLRQCGSDDLAVVELERDGPALRGQVIAENVSGRACQIENKPGVTPLRPDGTPLPVKTIITMEWISRGAPPLLVTG